MRTNADPRKNILLALGVVLAIVLVFQGIHKFHFEESVVQTEHSGQTNDDAPQDLVQFEIDQEYITSSSIDSPDFKSSEIIEIFMNEEDENEFLELDFISTGQLFKVLFQKVISPNAP